MLSFLYNLKIIIKTRKIGESIKSADKKKSLIILFKASSIN